MSLETGTRIPDLVPTNPVGATDFVSQGDDHIRLIKACLQGSFPSLGADAVTATALELSKLAGTDAVTADFDKLHEVSADAAELNILDGATIDTNELNRLDGVTSDIQDQLDALSGGKQPLDSDLTALAGLTTAPYGRDFNVLADNAALASKIKAIAPTWTGQHDFTAGYVGARYGTRIAAAGAAGLELWKVDAPANLGKFALEIGNGTASFYALTDNHGTALVAWRVTRDAGANITLMELLAPTRAAKIAASTSTTLVTGQIHNITGNATLPAIGDGEWVCIVNNSASPITITEHSGDATYLTALGVSVSTITVPPRGRIVATGAGSGVTYVSGEFSGYT